MSPLLYALFTAQALAGHRRYNVSIAYMRDALYLQHRRRMEHWDKETYERELVILAMRYPMDALKHMKYGRKDLLSHGTTEETTTKEESSKATGRSDRVD